MLSLSPRAMYNFEPLRSIHRGDSDLENWGQEDLSMIVPTMRGIFDCDPVFLEGLKWGAIIPDDADEGRSAFQIRGMATKEDLLRVEGECMESDPLVVKTIRLRLDKFMEWQGADDHHLDWLKVRRRLP